MDSSGHLSTVPPSLLFQGEHGTWRVVLGLNLIHDSVGLQLT